MDKYITKDFNRVSNILTKQDIKYNDTFNKIVVLKKIDNNILKEIKQEILDMYIDTDNARRNIKRVENSLKDIYKELTPDNLFNYYFEKHPFSDLLISFIFKAFDSRLKFIE